MSNRVHSKPVTENNCQYISKFIHPWTLGSVVCRDGRRHITNNFCNSPVVPSNAFTFFCFPIHTARQSESWIGKGRFLRLSKSVACGLCALNCFNFSRIWHSLFRKQTSPCRPACKNAFSKPRKLPCLSVFGITPRNLDGTPTRSKINFQCAKPNGPWWCDGQCCLLLSNTI